MRTRWRNSAYCLWVKQPRRQFGWRDYTAAESFPLVCCCYSSRLSVIFFRRELTFTHKTERVSYMLHLILLCRR